MACFRGPAHLENLARNQPPDMCDVDSDGARVESERVVVICIHTAHARFGRRPASRRSARSLWAPCGAGHSYMRSSDLDHQSAASSRESHAVRAPLMCWSFWCAGPQLPCTHCRRSGWATGHRRLPIARQNRPTGAIPFAVSPVRGAAGSCVPASSPTRVGCVAGG